MSTDTTEQPAAAAADQQSVTRLLVKPIDFSEHGTHRQVQERQKLEHAYEDAAEEHDDCLEDYQDALEAYREAMNEETSATLTAKRKAYRRAKRAMEVAREAYYGHFEQRMATDDGTPVREALDRISREAFLGLVRGDIENTIVPPAGASS